MNNAPVQHEVIANGVVHAVFERHAQAKGSGVTLLFLHATGFHARVWDQIIARLPALHSVAVDLRGHGRSQEAPVLHWGEVVSDVSELVGKLDLTHIVGVGHSMGAHALIGAAAVEPRRYASLLALDPVIMAPEAYSDYVLSDPNEAISHPMARRRANFDSPADMMERLVGKGSYGLFEPAILRDYCEYGLLPAPQGGFTLACPPAIEASIYMTSRGNGAIFDAVRSLPVPVRVLRAKAPVPGQALDFSSSPTWPGLAAEFPDAEDYHYPEHTHFLPMQIPDVVSRHIRELSEAGDRAAGNT